jgi:hypothetical protein
MKIHELIKELEKYDPETLVAIPEDEIERNITEVKSKIIDGWQEKIILS